MAKLFSVSEFAGAAIATRCSGSVAAVIGDNVIAVGPVRPSLAGNSDVLPTVAISKARKDEQTIATGSARIDDAGRC